jgi:uncharacterized protein
LSITQRPAKLNKDVLTQLSVLFALGVTSPQDRDAIHAWVEGNGDRVKAKEVYETLSLLPRGEGWVWAPDFDILKRVRFPALKTLDTSATPESDGSSRLQPKHLAAADIGRLRRVLLAAEPTASAPALTSKSLKAAEERGFERGKRPAGLRLSRSFDPRSSGPMGFCLAA